MTRRYLSLLSALCSLALVVSGFSRTVLRANPRSHQAAADRQGARAARADLDEVEARQRRRADRVGETRSAARVVLDHVPRRSRSVRDGRSPRRRKPDGVDDERGHEDAKRRRAVERAATARHERVGRRRRRKRLDRLRQHDGQVCGDARHSGGHAGELHVSAGGARTAARAAAGRAESGEGAARLDCRARVSARALRRRAPVRTISNRTDGQGHHARRCRRFSSALLQARPRAHHRRRRRHARRDSPGHRKAGLPLARRRRPAGVFVSAASRGEADDDLSRRQAGLRTVDVCARTAGPSADTRPTTTRCRS